MRGPRWEHGLSQHTLQARSCMGLAVLWPGQVSPPSSFAATVSQRVSNPWDKIVPTHCPWPVGLTSQTMAAQGADPVPCPPPGDLTCSYAVTSNTSSGSKLQGTWQLMSFREFLCGSLPTPSRKNSRTAMLGQNEGLPT